MGGKAAMPTGVSVPSFFFEGVLVMENKDSGGCKCGGSGNCPDCPNKDK